MRPYEFNAFSAAIEQCMYQFQYRSKLVQSATWQGVDITSRPEMRMRELTHVSFGVYLPYEDLDYYRGELKPNLPWADDHFLERVCGQPINPGVQWEKWPYGKSAATFLEDGKFNHNYMERYWPKYAGFVDSPTHTAQDWASEDVERVTSLATPNAGIKYEYGDLNDVVRLLVSDPLTRQAYLPIWFPEDTGGGNKRAPCTIGYHFMQRDGYLDVNYEIRSCDFVRHFRDDLYLTVRLLLWVLDECRRLDENWQSIKPGRFFIQIGSFHMFINDWNMMFSKSSKV